MFLRRFAQLRDSQRQTNRREPKNPQSRIHSIHDHAPLFSIYSQHPPWRIEPLLFSLTPSIVPAAHMQTGGHGPIGWLRSALVEVSHLLTRQLEYSRRWWDPRKISTMLGWLKASTDHFLPHPPWKFLASKITHPVVLAHPEYLGTLHFLDTRILQVQSTLQP